MWEVGELGGWVLAHAVGKELELGCEVSFNTTGEDGGGAANDGTDGGVGEPRRVAKEEELGEEGTVDREGEEQGGGDREGSPAQGDAVAKEVKRGAEGVRDTAARRRGGGSGAAAERNRRDSSGGEVRSDGKAAKTREASPEESPCERRRRREAWRSGSGAERSSG